MAKQVKIPQDCGFPQLLEMSDKRRLASALQENLGATLQAQGQRIHSCNIKRMYYKPGRRCRLNMIAKIRNQRGERLGEQIYYGRILPPGKGRKLFRRLQQRNFLAPEFGAPLGFVPRWEMIVWAYPNDPNMRSMKTLAQPEKILQRAQAEPGLFGIRNGHRPATIAARLAKYVPGKRCAYFFDLALAEHDGAAPRAHTIFGKTYKAQDGEAAYAVMSKIWQTPACQNRAFRMPQPYGYDAALKMLWQEALTGRALAKIAGEVALPEIIATAGRSLAAFHDSGLNLSELYTLDFQLEKVRRAVEAVQHTAPQYAEACESLRQKLLAASQRMQPIGLTPVHGSFKFSHIFYDGREVVFIDFDGAHQGDPCYDLGRLIAYVGKLQAEGEIDEERARRTIANFCAAYRAATRRSVPQERIDWFASSHMLTSQIYKAMKSLDLSLLERLLALAKRWSEGEVE